MTSALAAEPLCNRMLAMTEAIGRAALHAPDVDFNDAMLPIGIACWLSLIQEELRL